MRLIPRLTLELLKVGVGIVEMFSSETEYFQLSSESPALDLLNAEPGGKYLSETEVTLSVIKKNGKLFRDCVINLVKDLTFNFL